MRILLAIDSSELSGEAIRQLAARPWPEDTAVFVFSVVSPTRLGVVGREGGQYAAWLTAGAESLVKSAGERLAATGLESVTGVAIGFPASTIIEHARDWGADFIWVGSHGRTGLSRFLMGSASRSVLHRAPCSVVLVKARANQAQRTNESGLRIFLAVDGSECSMTAARSIAGRPWPTGTEVQVVSVADLPMLYFESLQIERHIIDKIGDYAMNRGQNAIASAERLLSTTGLKVTSAFAVGDPRATILDRAKQWGSDLIVVGSHGSRGISRNLVGSVSEAVATHAHCTVEVIR
jgi:nucleotide-binding universal stress UspA family protein